jgi:hypothetical protein
MHRPISTRRLKKADFEADFFFIGCCRFDSIAEFGGNTFERNNRFS